MNRREFLTTGSAAAASLTGGIAAANAHAADTADARDVLSEPRRLSVALPWRDEIKGPGDFSVEHTGDPLTNSKATMTVHVGKRLRSLRWPKGRYEGTVSVLRGGGGGAGPVVSRSAQLELQ